MLTVAVAEVSADGRLFCDTSYGARNCEVSVANVLDKQNKKQIIFGYSSANIPVAFELTY